MSEIEKIRTAIDAAPKLHRPCTYEVALNTVRKNKLVFEHYRYVRASSERRAKLAAVLVDRTVFNYKRTHAGTAKPLAQGSLW
jgi:hypothetical protein